MIMFRRCSFCGKLKGIKFVSFFNISCWFKTTHGICDQCFDLWHRSHKKYIGGGQK